MPSIVNTGQLREPGSILLISCYELGHQPQGLAWPAAFLARAGFSPTLLDLAVFSLDEEKVRTARFVGISVPMHTALRLGALAARRIHELNPACVVCFYGLYAFLNAEYLLDGPADYVIGGEYEEPLVRLVEALDRGAEPCVEGVGRRGALAPPHLARLAFPGPVRAELPVMDGYARLVRDGREAAAGYVEASRGCKHVCRHCPIPPVYGGRFFVVPREVVLDDIRRQAAAGAEHITFGDPDFLNGPKHALSIVRSLNAEHPELTFDFTAKVEHLIRHRALLPELVALGCAFVVSAFESLSDQVLDHLEKGHTRTDISAALDAAREAGLPLRPTWVPFTPWTGAGDYVELLDFVEDEGLVDAVDPVQYAIRLLVPPGSRLVETAAMRPHLGALRPEMFTYEWKHPDPRMDRLQIEARRVVEGALRTREDAETVLDRLRALAGALVPERVRRVAVRAIRRTKAPYLTEPWFC
jgi:radical SAM superfamily enzyme YgiQ (UPF0313 family)